MSALTKLTQTEGICAACGGEKGALNFSFVLSMPEAERDHYKKIFEKMLELFQLVPEQEELKITLDTHSLHLQHSGKVFLGVVAVKGHPVVKSLQRMLRKAFKALGAPLPIKTRPSIAPALSVVPQPVSPEDPTRPLNLGTSPTSSTKGGGDGFPTF